MDDFSPLKRAFITLGGLLNSFLYFSTRRRFLGVTVSGWLKFFPILLVIVAFLYRWPFLWIAVGLFLTVTVRLVYWNAKRRGYISFIAESHPAPPANARPIPDNEKLPAVATGLFSVIGRESYVLQRPAEYWRAPGGDHAIMVEYKPGRFLYQFVKVGSLQQVETGMLVFGAHPVEALSIRFLTTWGTEYSGDEQSSQFMPGKHKKAGHVLRRAYLTFDNNNVKQSVWRALLRDAKQPLNGEQ